MTHEPAITNVTDPLAYPSMTCHRLDGAHVLYCGHLRTDQILNNGQLEELWGIHPDDYHLIRMYGSLVPTPRYQQAYDHDYHYTGRDNKALPLPPLLKPLLFWAKELDQRLNGVLLNWYDGQLGHYIGKHRDSRKGLIPGSPIVTVSFGEERTFRLRPWKGKGHRDFQATNGTVFVMPWETNLAWTHEVPHQPHCLGRRISVTFRAFAPQKTA